jgi:hypothetical protein
MELETERLKELCRRVSEAPPGSAELRAAIDELNAFLANEVSDSKSESATS